MMRLKIYLKTVPTLNTTETKMIVLIPPRTRLQEIVYQTILPYYSADILEKYNKVSVGTGSKILDMIQKDISHLEESKKQWDKTLKFNQQVSFESHLGKCGYNVSGQYSYQKDNQ